MNSYPMLNFIGRHGGWLAAALGLLPLAGAIWLTTLGQSAWWLAAGILAGIALFVAARSYVELVRVMVDMLLPK
jgi:hypothetical protein